MDKLNHNYVFDYMQLNKNEEMFVFCVIWVNWPFNSKTQASETFKSLRAKRRIWNKILTYILILQVWALSSQSVVT